MTYYNLQPLVLQDKIVYNQIMDRTVLHCDLNNFYASVEQKLHPKYDGLPLAVCGDPQKRHGIVLAKNQLAKEAGIKTGEPIWQSKQKCPNIVFVAPHFNEYVAYSKQVFEIYTRFTDRVESFGIDECWLDVTESKSLFGDGVSIANKLRELVKKETGLTISVGVSFTKILAKLGSDLKKPDATTVLDRSNYMSIIGKMSPSELIMVGKSTNDKLKRLNIFTIEDLSKADRNMLRSHFGVIGDSLINSACGIETTLVKKTDEQHIPKSVSNGTTTPRDIENLQEAKVVIYALSDMIAMRLRKYNLVANCVGLTVKKKDLSCISKQLGISPATANSKDIAEYAISVLKNLYAFDAPLRAITVSTSRLENKDGIQLSIFGEENEKEQQLEQSIDKIRQKYGYNSVRRGLLLDDDLTNGLHSDDDFLPFHQSK